MSPCNNVLESLASGFVRLRVGLSVLLGGHVVEVDGGVLLEPEVVSAAAPLVLAGEQPHPLDGRVARLARAADHTVLREAGVPFNKFCSECFSRTDYRVTHHVVLKVVSTS